VVDQGTVEPGRLAGPDPQPRSQLLQHLGTGQPNGWPGRPESCPARSSPSQLHGTSEHRGGPADCRLARRRGPRAGGV